MRTTFDLPDELVKRAKIAAVRGGSTLRDLVAEGLCRMLTEESSPKRKRNDQGAREAAKGTYDPIRSNQELAELLDKG